MATHQYEKTYPTRTLNRAARDIVCGAILPQSPQGRRRSRKTVSCQRMARNIHFQATHDLIILCTERQERPREWQLTHLAAEDSVNCD
jgi:hypothetical protein